MSRDQSEFIPCDIIHLGKHLLLKKFCESLLPLFETKQLNHSDIREKTFQAINCLFQHNKKLLHFLAENSRPVKIDLDEFMIHIAAYNYSVSERA